MPPAVDKETLEEPGLVVSVPASPELTDRQPDSLPLTPTQHEDTPKVDLAAGQAETVESVESGNHDGGSPQGIGLEDIPDVNDTSVPKPKVGVHTLSAAAIRGRIRRVFTRKIDGSAKVSEAIFAEYQAGGQGKKTLEDIFRQCGYDVEPWLHTVTG